MPALPSPGQVIRVSLTWTIGQDVTNGTRFYIQYTSAPPSIANLNAMATEVAVLAGNEFSPLYPSDTTLTGVKCQDLSTTSGFVGVSGASAAGTRVGPYLPAGNAMVVNYIINRHYRGGKPRAYFPGGVQTDLATPQTWTAAYVTLWNSNYGTFMATLLSYAGDSITKQAHVNVGYYSGVNPPITLPSGRVKQSSKQLATPHVDVVTNHLASPKMGTQRRRLISGG